MAQPGRHNVANCNPDVPQTQRLWAPWVLPILRSPIRNACVTIEDGSITSVDANISREQAQAHDAICFDDAVLAPGFVNAHAHIEYAAYDALVDGLPFSEWIADHIHRKRRLSPEQMAASARFGAIASIAGGITCIGDASYSGHAAAEMLRAGLRGRVYLEVFGDGHEPLADREPLFAQLSEVADRSGGLMHAGWSPHAPYTAGQRLFAAVQETGMPWMSHLHESAHELACTTQGSGPLAAWIRSMGWTPHAWSHSPIQMLAEQHLLGRHSVLVHAVHLSDRDVEAIAHSGAGVVHCPRSNARLGCGIADLARLDRAGVLVALGTDSPASAGPLDMFAEMRSMIEQQRAMHADATTPDAAQALRMATVNAAQVLGYDDLGAVVPGAAADLMVVETGPTSDPVTAVVLGGRPESVISTWIAGREVWRRDRNQQELRIAREGIADARALLTLPVAPAAVTTAH